MKTMTSREANQDFSRAKREARLSQVLITERGRPSSVLLSYDEYRRLDGQGAPTSSTFGHARPGRRSSFEPPQRQKAAPGARSISRRAFSSTPMSYRKCGARIRLPKPAHEMV